MRNPTFHPSRRAALLGAASALVLGGCGGGPGVTVTPGGDPPSISSQPAAATAATGGSVTFSVAASGSGLAYQWRYSVDQGVRWTEIAGAVGASYVLAAVHAYMNGWQYQVVVTGSGGTTTSKPVTLTVAPATGAALASFGVAPDGRHPTATPALGSDGFLYGATLDGGSAGTGTLFRVSPAGERAQLHSFGSGAGSEGSGPLGGLTLGPDGFLYGTTSNGGTFNNGVVFRATTDGAVTPLHSFSGGSDGAVPYGGVSVAADGTVYGTTFFGGANGKGTVFRIGAGGAFTVLHAFGAAGDGEGAKSEPVLGTDGSLYGTTTGGGAHGKGTVYHITAAGDYGVLHAFGAAAGDAQGPVGRLLQASDGLFYGTTFDGGASGGGTVFSLAADGTFALLHSFGAAGDALRPYAGLLQGLDGHLYGTAASGGAAGMGAVFRVTLAGAESVVHSFTGTADGRNPLAGLVQGAGGALYGACQFGGPADQGTVFELVP